MRGLFLPGLASWLRRPYMCESGARMRRYMQGTLDFACGIYAVINALSRTHGLDLENARGIFRESILTLSQQEGIWLHFLRNETDHYWLVRWLLGRWCCEPPRRLEIMQPFSDCLQPRSCCFDDANMYLPEKHEPSGPEDLATARDEALAVWQALHTWFTDDSTAAKAAILRFHRFMPGLRQPLVSHWTTAHSANHAAIVLHDASAEPGALFTLERKSLLPQTAVPALLRIVPESVVLLRRDTKACGIPCLDARPHSG